MPFTSGVFANVAGASSAAAGQIIQSAVWNNIHIDYSDALNQLMAQAVSLPSNRNILWMNGGLEIWQRGAGSAASISLAASTVAYTADRWYLATDVNQASVVSAQAGLVDESNLCSRVQRTAAQTGTNTMRFAYPLDTDEIIRCIGNIVTLSFRVRAGANFSPTSGTLNIAVFAGTGAVGKRNATPYTSEVSVISSSVNLTTTTVLVTVTSSVVVPTSTTQMEVQFNWTPVGIAGAADYFEIDDVQLEPNLSTDDWTPTSYDRLDFKTMLSGCLRHYYKSFSYSIAPVAGGGIEDALAFRAQATAQIGFWLQYPQEMRTTPGLTKYHPVTATGSNWYNFTASATVSASFSTTLGTTKSIFVIGLTASAIDTIYLIHMAASAGI